MCAPFTWYLRVLSDHGLNHRPSILSVVAVGLYQASHLFLRIDIPRRDPIETISILQGQFGKLASGSDILCFLSGNAPKADPGKRPLTRSRRLPKEGEDHAMAASGETTEAKLEKITVTNEQGLKLVGVLHEGGSKDVVVICHGFRSNKENDISVNLATALAKEGISAFRFDFSGNGESEGSFDYANYHGEVDDLRSVVEYYRGGSRETRAIIGHSKGGDVVLLYASKHPDIIAVVNASGRYDLKEGIEERFGKDFMEKIKNDGFFDVKDKEGKVQYRISEKSLMERLNINMQETCLQIDKSCRILTVHGSADEIIPVGDALKFAKILPNHELQIIEEADHCYTSYQAELASVVSSFIKSVFQDKE
ncbi:hypothetical protein MLD38_005825 [Melastoma candidum]|uniref:Uncharacterized protein n=1 Tax=Melastoma candidum TaxID=119954 RepID=A0ACB9RKN1_9MYRT|nr:hypothetical protein MLD38_005825 [Melastoma candidum]